MKNNLAPCYPKPSLLRNHPLGPLGASLPLLLALWALLLPRLCSAAPATNLWGIWVGTMGDADNPNEFYYEFAPSSDGSISPQFSAPLYGEKYMRRALPSFTLKDNAIRFPTFEGTYLPDRDIIRGKAQFSANPIEITLTRTNQIKAPELETAPPSRVKPAWVFHSGAPIWASPLLVDNMLLIGNDEGNFFALDSVTGTVRWKFKTAGMVRCQPVLLGQAVVFTSDDGNLYSVSLEGKLVWKFDLHSQNFKRQLPSDEGGAWDYSQSSPLYHEGRIYVGSADHRVYAIDAAKGTELWHFESDQVIRSTPVAAGDMVFVGSWSGKLYALDCHTGKMVWVVDAMQPITSQPAISQGKVVFGSRGAYIWCCEAKTGKELWKRNFWESWVESSPSIEGSWVYVGSSDLKRIQALDFANGHKRWACTTTGYPWGKPVLHGKYLYVGTVDSGKDSAQAGFLYVLDKASGTIVSKIAPKAMTSQYLNGVFASPAFTADLVLFGSLNGDVYAYPIASLEQP